MTKQDAVREFRKVYKDLYKNRVDYWTAQLAWSDFVDGLNRDGRVTDKQRDNWETPFRYGKHLRAKTIYSR